MSQETIRLQGGPMDGERMAVRGPLDTVTVHLRDPDDMLIQPEAKLPLVPTIKTGIYRRSLVTKHIFVWQP